MARETGEPTNLAGESPDSVVKPTEIERETTVTEEGTELERCGPASGISIVADIARTHDWTVTVAVSESGGARFELLLSEGSRQNP